ncbi:phosphotransferase [Flavimaricola marinus]|uniref:Choline/ethanolamine kinase n=1 Tax=Flavimaricola marinus TaxID=1819565 RepID=A0A238LEY3_9RHOB|nr:phosphotransferase [Flavimaricola marinus]SMY07516.1 Choline/ethanolamine kinase [Flavimaricola marinus]
MTGIEKAMGLSCWVAPHDATPLDGGITNENIRISDQGRDYVVRLGGDIPEHMVMRWNELSVSRAAHAAGIAPGVHHHEAGVLVLDFVEATALSETDLHDEAMLLQTVDLVRRLHGEGPLHLRGPVLTFWVFHILRDYAGTLRSLASDHVPKLDELLDQARDLERAVGPVDLVLGHNDLLPANILRGPDRLWLIDWEYAGFNSPLFDLGGLATNADLGQEAEAAMLTRYFGTRPSAALWHSYSAMKCASLLRETMWSMVSERTSALDFDYADYTAKNLERYARAYAQFKTKERP